MVRGQTGLHAQPAGLGSAKGKLVQPPNCTVHAAGKKQLCYDRHTRTQVLVPSNDPCAPLTAEQMGGTFGTSYMKHYLHDAPASGLFRHW
jgi:hypothetical protein